MQLLAPITITAASGPIIAGPFAFREPPKKLTVQANFVYGSGGTSVDCYVQTTLDNGSTWVDIANFHYTTSSARTIVNLSDDTPIAAPVTAADGGLTANTAISGILDAQIRLKITTTGTYAGNTSLAVDASAAA
jgi:hypothetical protein